MNNEPAFISKRGHEYGVQHVLAPKAGALVEVIADTLQLPKEQIQDLLDLGSIYRNHERVSNVPTEILLGDYVRVHTKPRRYFITTTDLLIFENDDFVVVNKPSGIPVHATVDNRRENLLYFLSQKMNCDLKVTHRLDVATQGLIVFAKTEEFQKDFNQYLTQNKIQKIYRAIVHGKIPVEMVGVDWIHYMEPSPRAPKKVSAKEIPGWQKCVLQILESRVVNNDYSEVIIELKTGRTHQIRSQCSANGFPIVGDTMYGSIYSCGIDKIALQSCGLQFPSFDFSLPNTLTEFIKLQPHL
jgi:23S rRNA pseudouridine1911/1915/1917 synthase